MNRDHLKILIVDDDPQMHRLISLFLQNKPYHLDKASNGRIALSKIASEEYDLIISDLQMPETDGIELIKQIRREKNSIPVIIISAYGLESMAENALREGASYVLQKPFEASKLIKIIDTLLPGGENITKDH